MRVSRRVLVRLHLRCNRKDRFSRMGDARRHRRRPSPAVFVNFRVSKAVALRKGRPVNEEKVPARRGRALVGGHSEKRRRPSPEKPADYSSARRGVGSNPDGPVSAPLDFVRNQPVFPRLLARRRIYPPASLVATPCRRPQISGSPPHASSGSGNGIGLSFLFATPRARVGRKPGGEGAEIWAEAGRKVLARAHTHEYAPPCWSEVCPRGAGGAGLAL